MTPSRDRWSSKLIFIFAAVGSAIGLGNIWRFPYLVGKYGGGAFLIPYVLMLFVMGFPLLLLEFGLGQKMQQGAIGAFKKIHPKLAGIGLSSILCGFVIVCYYTVVMAWCLNYVFHSFTLAWGENTKDFFFNNVLQLSPSIDQTGSISIVLLASLVACWIGIYFSVWKGVKSVGKVVAITMPLPIILLLILLIKGLTLPGAGAGLVYYLKPNFSALLDLEVWNAAMSQIFFTLTIGFGVMIAYASYQNKNSDIAKSALLTALINSSVSFIAGFAVFTTLGYMSHQSGVPVAELANQGPSLAFIVFPQALSLIPGAKLFAVLFFIMLLTLAIDSAFSLVEAVAAVIYDKLPHSPKKEVVLYICLLGFLGGIIFITNAGLYYLDIVDHFITQYGLVLVGLFQTITIGWIYGARKLRLYINEVSDIRIGLWWDIFIKYVIPACLIALLVNSLRVDLNKPYGDYPSGALALWGWGTVGLVFTISFLTSFFSSKK